MKMPRSQCETENVQFVQELAEVDGPFEAPININFRDLTKLELPSLVWNRGDMSPKKMKITNTGHTVIVSGKWKCERPYLTGGPLLGKYVFSQIHFHWGQDDCKGSEHQVCGEGFPLEMHVAHFKTEYMTQECALREKDGMVVVVYLFKLQDEPNQSLKKIINCLPNVKHPSTSHAIDPRPILSLCNSFTDDYFMYWGSVVTSTCAHILLWIICREPFGISREQVNEFRKIMDSSQQPICRNSRDIQPLHKRNVFHVNASKHLDEPLLPIKKLLGCYCKGSEDNENVKHMNDCQCHPTQNQEDVEGSFIEYPTANQCLNTGDKQALHFKASLPNSCFPNQTFFVHTAQVQSVTMVLKKCGSDPIGKYRCLNKLKKIKSENFEEINKKQIKYISQSCCFLPKKEVKKIKGLAEKRKTQERKRPFNSMKAFSQILHSLETLKNHTVKKLKEIESINQEIKEMKPFCQDTEDRKWIRKIENIMTRQRKFTLKTSQGCFSEIKKLAKDCNFDKFFDAKALSEGDRTKKLWMTSGVTTNEGLPCFDNYMKGEGISEMKKQSSKQFDLSKAIHFSTKAEKLVQSFFEDIKDSEGLQETVKKDLNLKKIKSFYYKQKDSNSVLNENKGYITQKMFTLGNLGSRFFTEVTTEELINLNQWENKKQNEELFSVEEIGETKNILDKYETEKTTAPNEPEFLKDDTNLNPKNELLISLHRANNAILLSKTDLNEIKDTETLTHKELLLSSKEKLMPNLENSSDSDSALSNKMPSSRKKSEKTPLKKTVCSKHKKITDLMGDKMYNEMEAKVLLGKRSISNLSTESTETQRMIIAKIRESRKEFWEQKRQRSSGLLRISSKRLYSKSSSKKFEGYYLQKKNLKLKKRKSHRNENAKKTFYGMSSTSKEESNLTLKKQKWKRVTKAKIKLEIEKASDSTSEPGVENFLISPERKRLKLESKKLRECSSLDSFYPSENNKMYLTDTETRTILTNQSAEEKEKKLAKAEKETFEQKGSAENPLKEEYSANHERENSRVVSKVLSRTSTKRTFRASSVDSKVSFRKTQESVESKGDVLSFFLRKDSSKKEIQIRTVAKPLPKNRSLTIIMSMPKLTAEFTQKIHADSIDKGIKRNKDASLVRKLLDSTKKNQEKLENETATNLSHEISSESYKKPDESQEPKKTNQTLEGHSQTPSKFEYEVGFFTTTSSQVDDELLPTDQLEKDKMLKSSDAERNRSPGKEEPHELNLPFHKSSEKHAEILQKTDSNKSFGKEIPKGNVDSLAVDNKDLQTSVSCSTLRKSPTSKPHSAESLLSQTKSYKLKSKKRPHCCKRISRNYIRKSSTVFRKPYRADRQANFLNLADEEQLKIISENVAKYLKEKLEVENKGSDSKNSLNNIEEVFTDLKVTQDKKEIKAIKVKATEKSEKEKKPDKKLGQASLDKKTEKKEKPKRTGILSKPKVIKTPVQIQKEKSDVAPPKPANNFIKLNKLMAGKYKRLIPPAVNKVESKEKLKSNQESKPKEQKKKTEKSPVPKDQEQPNARPETPSLPKNSNLSPKISSQKESKIKSPKNYKKPNSLVKNSNDRPETPKTPNKLNELKCEPNSKSLLPSSVLQKTSQQKKCLIPTYTLTTHISPPTDLVENQKKKMSAYHSSLGSTNSESLQSDAKTEGEMDSEILLRKELEYFIRLQKCKNNDTSENLLNFEKSKLLQDNQSNVQANDSFQNLDFSNKGIILVEKKDLMEYSSSGSEFAEDVTKYNSIKGTTDSRNGNNFKNKDIVTVTTPQECNDPKIGILAFRNDKQEETNSDSSYDCKISITLNTNPSTNEENNEIQNFGPCTWLKENSNRRTTSCLEESSSQSIVTKNQSKKRNDVDISLEMKHKLFEILEGEIKREIGITCGGSSGNSSDGLTFKGEDSDGNNRSQSTESSCDNLEVLAQISNTMRQYLAYLKDMKQSSDKETKKYDET